MLPRRKGQIVNISSARGALRGQPFAAGYCATKMGCLAMFQAMAEELRPLGIRVWSLLPEAVNTELIAGTQLAKRGLLAADRLAAVIAHMLALPSDAEWSDPLVAPMGGMLEPSPARVA
jgi:short-subunit dehydrogenase